MQFKEMACSAILLCFLAISPCFYGLMGEPPHSKKPRRLLLDTDMDTDDFFALLYLLKQNRSEFDLKVSFSFSVFFFYLLSAYVTSLSTFGSNERIHKWWLGSLEVQLNEIGLLVHHFCTSITRRSLRNVDWKFALRLVHLIRSFFFFLFCKLLLKPKSKGTTLLK